MLHTSRGFGHLMSVLFCIWRCFSGYCFVMRYTLKRLDRACYILQNMLTLTLLRMEGRYVTSCRYFNKD